MQEIEQCREQLPKERREKIQIEKTLKHPGLNSVRQSSTCRSMGFNTGFLAFNFSVFSVDSVAIMFLRLKEKAPPVEAGPFRVLR